MNAESPVTPNPPLLSTSPSIPLLVELQRQRVFCIKSQSRCDRSTESFIARHLGFDVEAPEAERKKVFETAAKIRKAVEKGDELKDLGEIAEACAPIILLSAQSREAWDKHRSQVEKKMRELVRDLPAYEFTKGVKGFGELGFAIIIGETGDLSNYATYQRVWKRLGLAVIQGERQRRVKDAEAAKVHGYNPKRRAEIWSISDSMFRHQWRGEKEGVAPHALGHYGEVYAKRKAATEGRGWTLAHRDADARRIMCKALIADLWAAWNGKPAEPVEESGE